MVNFLPTIRLTQSILKRKFVDKPLKRAFEKYKPRGLFSEFYGILMNHFTKLWLLLQAFTPLNWTSLLYSDDTFYQYITSLCKPDYHQVYRSHGYPVGIRLLRTPWGHAIVSVLSGCLYMKAGTLKKKFTDSWWMDVKTQTEFLNFVPLKKIFPPDHSKQTSFLFKPKSVLKFTSFHVIFIYFPQFWNPLS